MKSRSAINYNYTRNPAVQVVFKKKATSMKSLSIVGIIFVLVIVGLFIQMNWNRIINIIGPFNSNELDILFAEESLNENTDGNYRFRNEELEMKTHDHGPIQSNPIIPLNEADPIFSPYNNLEVEEEEEQEEDAEEDYYLVN